MPPIDALGRPFRALRLSVTDRCNLRCEYCMPEREYAWIARRDLLDFDEIVRLVTLLKQSGVDKVRLTGGEPLLRRDLPDLVASLSRVGLADLAMTTNGLLLADHATALAESGLRRLNISLDTLLPDRFRALTRQDAHARVMHGIRAAAPLFHGTKLDAVIMRGVNDDEIEPLLDFGASIGAEVRFIEYMDVAGATHWTADLVVARSEMLDRLRSRFGRVDALDEPGSSAPAGRFRLPDGRVFGIIASTTTPFCRECDRARLTADGVFFTCLYATAGLPLREAVRRGASDEELAGLVESRWRRRDDRGAEERAALARRTAFVPVAALKADLHLEMHSRGG